MKKWEILSMSVGSVILIGSVLFFGVSPLNIAGAALILFPPVLYLVRRFETRFQGGRAQ